MSPKHRPEIEFELSDEDLRSDLSEEELKHISGGFLGAKPRRCLL